MKAIDAVPFWLGTAILALLHASVAMAGSGGADDQGAPGPVAVPEPATLALLAAGAGALLVVRRLRNRPGRRR